MRTTINLPDELLARLKKEALTQGITLTELVESTLRERMLRGASKPSARQPVRLKTCGTGGVLPGIDLDDSAALLDLMESERDRY